MLEGWVIVLGGVILIGVLSFVIAYAMSEWLGDD